MGGHMYAIRHWHKINPSTNFGLKRKRWLHNEIFNWLLNGNQLLEMKNCCHFLFTF
jgi:hypothetical protein